jgi:preprotein translocase subunit SecA
MTNVVDNTVSRPRRRFSFWRNADRVRPPSPREWNLVRQVQQHAATLESASDRDLRDIAATLREAVDRFGSLKRADEEATPHVLGTALVGEAVRRTSGLKYHDVQILAGLLLASGHIAEMATGEGKTIVTAMPAFLAWLDGRQSHVATPNSYLASRDCEQLRPALELLGVSVALLPERDSLAGKRAAYQSDVVYGTGYEFGFDYLRDQLTLRSRPHGALGRQILDSLRGRTAAAPSVLQSRRELTVVDEIDSVLIDEALTPLILSESANDSADGWPYLAARDLAEQLVRGEHFHLDSSARAVQLTTTGREHIFRSLEQSPITALRRPWDVYLRNALQARYLLHEGVDYVVRVNAVQLVDEKTGRIFDERSWRDGLHQAVEAVANVPITGEKSSAARITRQRFYQLYDSLCGMTGTAVGAEEEFDAFYTRKTVIIPRHRPCRRLDLPDRFFATTNAKFLAIVTEVAERHRCGQPVLLGSRTIHDSRVLSDLLKAARLPHQVLNGLQDAAEAEIIAQAGRYAAITVATNMAGRGTDIKPDQRACAAGGLHVIGVERQETRRIDRQLAGRAGRQGDVGSSRCFVSADDELLQCHSPQLAELLRRSADHDGEAHTDFAIAIERLQHTVEQQGFAHRRQMIEHDCWQEDILAAMLGEAAR